MKWCLITRVSPISTACWIEEVSREDVKHFVTCRDGGAGALTEWIKRYHQYVTKTKRGTYYIKGESPVFEVGEIFPINNEYERELTGCRRKPSKWDVDYEVYGSFKKAYAKYQKLCEVWEK